MRGAFICLSLLTFAAAAHAEDGKLSLTVTETAGIRRFGYPVYAKLTLPREAAEKDNFRLLADGKAVPAQFRRLPGDKKAVALDFTLSCAPLEKRTFAVEYGEKVEAGPEPKGGIRLTKEKGVYTIRSGGMTYVMDPAVGWLRSVRDGKKEFLAPEKELAEDRRPAISVVREGPVAVCLRVTSERDPGYADFTFPRSKSWVEVAAVRDDPRGELVDASHRLAIAVAGKRVLADFGGGSSVYTTLAADQHAELVADDREKQRWSVSTGAEGKQASPFVVPAPDSTARAEGWAHVMDDQRCVAVAVEGFGRGVKDRIRIKGNGELELTRDWPRKKGPKTYRFWLHFVDMPVQVGALTSPQSMMAPLAVEVK
jgi:hypothetical protein